MKEIIVLLFLLFTFQLKAEYSGFYFKLTIETKSGLKIKGYTYKAEAYLDMDSLKSTFYLKRVLNENSDEKMLDFIYYTDLISYTYSLDVDSIVNERTVYTFSGKSKLLLSDIKLITVDQMVGQTYAIGILNELTLSDSIWMKRRPIKQFSVGAYLCSYQLFVHKNSKKIRRVIKDLQILQDKSEKCWKKLEELEKEGEANRSELEELDRKIFLVVQKLRSKRVIVISFCTC